ncbi:hypothetical protein L596_004602 [Steinernema carpocapsae]|uniref:Uncharacterized protein n=1 Tax=Steinernema carpocapsae TaxID=34508 RepID=A0A4U8UZW4_STECR|nr:hypothetical protein L596_004602 [Steinernema carpocapsae]
MVRQSTEFRNFEGVRFSVWLFLKIRERVNGAFDFVGWEPLGFRLCYYIAKCRGNVDWLLGGRLFWIITRHSNCEPAAAVSSRVSMYCDRFLSRLFCPSPSAIRRPCQHGDLTRNLVHIASYWCLSAENPVPSLLFCVLTDLR